MQLRSVIADVANEFHTYRGIVKDAQVDDTTYYSAVTIDGSKDNEIEVIGERLIQYHAYIADSANKDQAQKLVQKWKEKIQTAAPDYQMTQVNSVAGKRKTMGYRFSKLLKNMCNISIVYRKREIDDYYWVLLTITRPGKEMIKTEERREE